MSLAAVWDAAAPWLQLLSVLGAVVQCLGVWALWSLTRKFVTREDCEACHAALADRLKRQEDGAGELKCVVSAAPTKDELAKVDKADEALRGDIKALTEAVKGVKEMQVAQARQLSLLMQHHLGRRE